jgi:hypothetical protein
MSNRRALIIGSWLAKGRDNPSPQKVKSITDRWEKLFRVDDYSYRSLGNKRRKPDILINPKLESLTAIFARASQITNDTELLLFFVGHSTAFGEDDLRLILGLSEKGEERYCNLSWLLSSIQQAQIRKIVIILDTCHAGRTHNTFRRVGLDYYAMLSTGEAYAFEARFSDGILKALEDPLRKKDQRIDQRAGGMTYQKVFQFALSHVFESASSSGIHQNPVNFGDPPSDILVKAPVVVPVDYNQFASDRTVYGRVFRLLDLVKSHGPLTYYQLQEYVYEDRCFLLRKDEVNGDQYLSSQRLLDYLDFLRKAEWLVELGGKYLLTPKGTRACKKNGWNKLLLEVIEEKILPEEMSLELLDSIVSELLTDMIPATPIRIKERAAMQGVAVPLVPATRVALQVLPISGRFMKGAADAIFPSERGFA